MAILSLDERRFNALAGYTRDPRVISLVQEYDWLSTGDERLVAVLTWDRYDHDFGWIVLARDRDLKYRAIKVNASMATSEEARADLIAAMTKLQTAPDEEFFQNDEAGDPVDFFLPQGPPDKLNRNFKLLLEHPRYSPARDLISAMMRYYRDMDGNFIEQFQTTGFDPRIWELYLFATFVELGFARDEAFQAPDFRLTGPKGEFAVEATTANAPDGRAPPLPDDAAAYRTYAENYVPIKLARALKRKLDRDHPYWAEAAVQDLPFVLAVQDFHAVGSVSRVVPAATEYVFGVRHSMLEGQRRIEWIEEHRYGRVAEPSGFFRLPSSENVSAVLVNPQGTLVKFNRLGQLAGFGDPRVRMIRRAVVRNDADLADPQPVTIVERVDDPDYKETWIEGMVVLHNPNALRPLNPALLPGATHEFLQSDGRIMSLMANRPVYSSQTTIMLEGDEVAVVAGEDV